MATNNSHEVITRLAHYGISYSDAVALRRIAMTLHRWHEMECGDGYGCIERDETTNLPYWYNSMTNWRHRVADRETGALKRLYKIMDRYPDLAAYVQGDPRGASLYVYRKDDLNADTKYGIESVYSSIGCAIYK